MKKVICDICGAEYDENRGADENGYTQIAHIEIMDSRYFQDSLDVCNNCITNIRNYLDTVAEEMKDRDA